MLVTIFYLCDSSGGETISKTVYIFFSQGAGMNSPLHMIMFDANGKASQPIKLDCVWRDDFEKGATDKFVTQNVGIAEEVERIKIKVGDGPFKQDWYVSPSSEYACPAHLSVQLSYCGCVYSGFRLFSLCC